MRKKPRCSECRRPFEPDVRARAHQQACKGCRQARRNRLARERRLLDIDLARDDERARQKLSRRERREKAATAAWVPAPVPGPGPAVTAPGRPVSRAGFEAEAVDMLGKIFRKRDGLSRLSRAGFDHQALGILRELAEKRGRAGPQEPRCHGPP